MTLRASVLALFLLCSCDRVFGLIGDDQIADAGMGPDAAGDDASDARQSCAEYLKPAPPLTTLLPIRGIGAGDLDGDHRADLVVTQWNATNPAAALVTWIANANGLTNATRSATPAAGAPTDVAIGNVIGDSRADIVTLDPNDRMFHIVAPDPLLVNLPVNLMARSLVIGNITGTGYDTAGWVDADSSEYGEYVEETGMIHYDGTAPSPNAVSFADVRGDMDLETLIVSYAEEKLIIGKVGGSVTQFSGHRPLVVAGGRLLDKRFAAVGFDDSSVGVFTVTATDVIPLGSPLLYGAKVVAVRFVDLDLDGKDELLVLSAAAEETSGGVVHVYVADATGAYSSEMSRPAGADPLGMAVGDFNGDGYPDVAIANNDMTVSVLQNCR